MAKRHAAAPKAPTTRAERVIQPIYAVIGTRLREARTAAGMSQVTAAGKLSMSAASLANVERGVQRIQIHDLTAAAQVYNADAAWLLGGDPAKPAGDDASGYVLPDEAKQKVEVARMLFGEAVARLNEALGVGKKS